MNPCTVFINIAAKSMIIDTNTQIYTQIHRLSKLNVFMINDQDACCIFTVNFNSLNTLLRINNSRKSDKIRGLNLQPVCREISFRIKIWADSCEKVLTCIKNPY